MHRFSTNLSPMQIYLVFLRRVFRQLRILLAFTILVVATMLSTPMRAQTLQDYEFSTGVDASKWITTSDWTSIVPSGITYNLASTVNNIGFSFPFGDSTYTQFSVNSNGIFRLGSEATLSYEKAGMFDPEFYTRNNPKISGEVNKYGLGTGTDGYIRYAVTGTTPNRVLVCEYCMAPYQYSVSAQIIWQVQLHETTGEVTIVYGSTTPSYSISYLQTGLATSPTDIVLLSPDTHTPVYSNTHNNTVYNTWHGTNRYYSFMLPNSTCPRPESIAVSDIGTSSLTATWVDNGGATQWEVRLDSRNVQGTPVVVNTPTYTFTGLTNGTDYSVRVRGICGPGDTTAVRSRSAQTLCGYLQLPYSEGFEDALGTLNTANGYWPNNLPNCWDYNNEGYAWSMYPYVILGPGRSSMQCMQSHVDRISNSSSSPEYAFLPLTDSIRHPVNSLELRYYMRRLDYTGKCIVGITPDPTDISTFIPVDSAVSTNNIWIQRIVHFNNYTGPHGRVTMLFPKQSNPNWAWIDDIYLFSHNSFDTVTHTACNSYTWPENGTTYTNSGTYNHTLPNAEGYDSIITLQLTIYHSYAGDTTAAVCDSITWRGNYYMESGNYIDTIFLSPLVGCDSTATLHLTVNHRSGLPAILPGATESHFSVSSTQTVQFSKGNLQYQASTGLWRFAEHQYDYIGDDNTHISSTYDGWIDLFGWGTSGWNSGATEYQPYSSFANSNRYQPGGDASNDLTGSYAEADWGWHNAIQNGGNRNHLWRTLIHTEWEYLFNTRTTNTNLGTPNARYAKASVNGTKGVILFPDEYTHPANVAVPLGINATDNTGWDGNTYSTTDWDKMDSAGAVFLPAARMRNGTALTNIGLLGGYYWAADRYNDNNSHAHMLKFNNTSFDPSHHNYRYLGISVRPVHNTEPIIPNDTVAEACNSFTWWNTNYTNSTNTPTHLYATTAGCDSLVTLHLTINLSTTGDTTATACDSFTWWGTTYTSSTNTATHTFTNAAGCDSVVTLHLTIKNSTTGDTTVTTCNSFTWWNTNYTNSTNSATHTFTNAAGCDSVVTLHLTINHSNTGDTNATACNSFTWWNTNYTNSTNSATHTFTNVAGCDSVVTLHLTINHSNTGDTNATACNIFTWWGNSYTSSTNSATHTFTNAAGCDSTVILHLTINHSNTGDTSATACNSFNWWGNSYTSSTNSATHTFTNAALCDSVVTLHLTINHSNTGDTSVTACNSFTWWGTTYTSSTNTATHSFTNAAGCDSVVTLHLTINHSNSGDTTATACNSFTWWGTSHTSSTNTATHTFTNAAGCDSVVTLHLTINHSNTGDTNATACNSFTWWNTNFTNSTNSATHTFTNAAGCDSVVTLHLTINHVTTGDTTTIACNSFTWWGTTYTSSTNTATHTFTNAAGCDSVVTLHLTINHSNTSDTNATACNSFNWWGNSYTSSTNSATHTFTNAAGCDSVVTLHLTINHSNTGDTNATACNSFTWWNTNYTNSTNSATHSFTNAAGCDSVVTLHLTVNYSTTGIEDTTVCNSIVWHGTEYTTSTNTPTFTCLNAAGCDSVTTLHLTVNHCSTTPITICDSYTWRGHTYTATGIYIDGTDTLNLTVNHSNTGDTTTTACDSFTWWGTTYTSSTNTATHTFTNAAGCDSTVTLHLTIKNSSTGDTTTTACNSFTWWNTNYTNSTNSASQTFTNAAGCDSVVTLHLTINHSTTGDTTVTACDSFTWWNTNYTNSTNSATHTFTNVVGCDSVVTLHLTVNNSTTGDTTVTACDSFNWWGSTYTSSTNTATQTFTNLAGCDYVVTLHLTINHSNTGIEDTTVCNSYVWHGTTYTASTNTPTFTCLNAAGCDSVTTLHLTVNQCSSTSVTTCDSYTWRGHTYTATGIYTDGIDTLHLTINHSNTGDTTVTACDNFTWHGTTYTGSTQNSTFTIQNSVGCDSVVTLQLTINHSNAGDTNVTACNSFTWWNTNYTNSTNSATHTFTNVAGCDSVVTLHLTVNHSNTGDTTVTACDSFTWWGTNYTNNTNTATHTFTNATGCDSVVTLHLTVNYSSTGIEDTTVCNSFIWHGTEYTSSTQNPTFTIQNSVGCDSTVTLHLTVNQCSSTTVTVCDSYIWHGNTYTTTGIYTDGTDTLNLTINNSTTGDTTVTACDSFIWHGTTYTGSTQNSTFTIQNSVGCDSVVTLHLTVNPTATINHTPDTTILIGDSVTLHVNNIDNVTWYDSDNNIISISDSLVISPTASTTYYISGFNQDTSIALNGDFEAGNVYFTSGYTYTSNLVPEGKYYVGPNAHNYHAGFPNWPDHTTGNGNYMIVNGTTSNGITVWSQTVPVIPHTDYDFSAWVCNVSLGNPDNVAYLQFSINGTQLGNIFHCPASLYTWEQFYELWNSGDNTTATISILNLNTTSAGNDFGIDDISFSALTSCIGYDSIHVNIQSNSHTYIDICDNQLPYTWNGSTFTSGGVYDVTIPRPAGIDSIATLHLTVKNSTTGDTTATACDSFTWWNTNYTNSTNTATHTFTNAAGCDSVVTLHLTVNYSNTGIEDTTVCNSFVWHGTTYTASTNTPTFTCLNAAGCDSVTTLHLIVNQCSSTSVTACDSFTWRGNTYNATGNYIDGTDTLHLTINLSSTGDTTATACDSLTWWNTNYSNSTNTATHTFTNAAGCDSVVTLHLTINFSSTGIEDTTVCNSFIWHGTTYTESTQNSTFTIQNSVGCDSTVTLHLTVNQCSSTIDTACDSYTWHGNTYTATGIYTDNADTLHLTINHSTTGDTTVTACDSFTWHGITYTGSTQNSTFSIQNSVGCDSVVTLHLTVNYSNTGIEDTVVCNSFVWHGTTYTESTNTPTYTCLNAAGCDSVTTLHLTVNQCSSTSVTACDSYTWRGSTYTTTGIYTDNADTLHLTINLSTTGDTTATACDSFTWHGTTYTESTQSPTFTIQNANGCDSTITLSLTIYNSTSATDNVTSCVPLQWIDGNTYTSSTDSPVFTIQSVHGCDSVVTLHFELLPASYTDIVDSFCTGTSYQFGALTLTEGGLYTDTLTATNTCDSIVSLNLTKLPLPYINIVKDDDCQTQTHHIHVETDVDYLYWTCDAQSWNNSWGSVHSSNLTVNSSFPITFTLMADYHEYPTCPNTAMTTLQPIVQPHALMTVSPESITYETPTLVALSQSTGAKSLQWYIDGDDAGNSHSITYTPPSGYDSVVVTLIAFSDLCSDTTEKTIPIKQQTLYLPNAFTPNESTNNTFSVFYDGIIEYELYIYNRQGILLFQSKTNGEAWDGRYNGMPCPEGSYVWLVKYRSEVDPQYWHYDKGTVTILY